MNWQEYIRYMRRCDYERIGCTPPLIIMCLVVVWLMTSCKTQYIPIETVRTERVEVHDSVYIETVRHDSVTIRSKGDTLLIEHWRTEWRDRWHDRWHDSIRVDSVQVPYPVERKLSRWERIKMDFGELLIGLNAIFVILFCIYLARRKVSRDS